MNNETLRMQMLAGVITESEYKTKLQENKKKKSLKEHFIAGGIVGVGAINQIPPREKADYEMAFEHFLGSKYINEAEEMVDPNMLKSYIDQMVSLADDMEYTPEMVDELENLKNTLSDGSMSKEDALNIAQKTIDITGDDIDAAEALNQAISGDYELGEGKEVKDEISMNEEDKVDYDALATTLGVDPREAERMYDAFQAMKNEGKEVEAKISMNEAEGGNDWWVKADEELGLDFDGEDLEDLAINADESWQADFAQQVLDIDASDYEDYKNQVSAIYDETNPF